LLGTKDYVVVVVVVDKVIVFSYKIVLDQVIVSVVDKVIVFLLENCIGQVNFIVLDEVIMYSIGLYC
jgi:hypothetical protein